MLWLRSLNKMASLLLFAAFLCVIPVSTSHSWSLSYDQRRQFLRHYAPLLFKRVDESSHRRGYDWVTSFDFDNDKDFSNNKDNWEHLNSFIDGSANSDWDIRPTMYTAMLEYMTEDGSKKDATLLYHIYHAKQDRSIHDWERVEIRLTDIRGSPGSGETVIYVVVTEHHDHKIRFLGHEDLNFMATSEGNHPMVWQAEQRKERNFFGKLTGFYGGEVHFVEDSFEKIEDRLKSDDKAEVDVNGGSRKNVHYIFVPQDDDDAVAYWEAQTLTQSNAFDLQSGEDRDGIPFSQVKRIKYELQDLADIFPTHWEGGFFNRHWGTESFRRVYLEEPLAGGIDGGPPVPTGLQIFYARSLDDEDDDEDRNGYPTKTWFWGYYTLNDESTSVYKDPARIAANGDPDSATGNYFRQHDFFSHDGHIGGGRWLPKGWHLWGNGGFDGRWIQLF